VVLVDGRDMRTDVEWNDTNRGSRIIREETVAVSEQTYVTAWYTANLPLKLTHND
jgi:hypothetical protein